MLRTDRETNLLTPMHNRLHATTFPCSLSLFLSTALIGSSSDLLNLFKNMSAKLELVEQGKLKPKSRGSDQELMVRVNYDSMQSGNSNVVVGDDQMMLFQVTTFSYKDLVFQNLSETIQDTKEPQKSILNDLIKEDNHLVGRSIIYNFRSQTIPPMIHFPGHPKPLKKWWKLMWWMRPQYTILRNGNTTNTTRSVVIQNAKSPAEVFYEKLEKHPEEPYGYGARLANGQWMSYMDLCRPFVRDILEV